MPRSPSRRADAPALDATPSVRVELFGIPRLAAGVREVIVPWSPGLTLAGVPERLAACCPALRGSVVTSGGTLAPGFVFNRNGRDFLRDPATPIAPGDLLLLLSADAGG